MKNFTGIATFFLVVFLCNTANAKIWRVNNTAGVVADFTTVQAAHDAAAAGDTIHIEPSASAYAGVTVSKLIRIVGNGYLLTTDTVLQANTNNSNLQGITFNTGSNGSSIEGVYISSTISVQDQNITIKRNTIAYVTYLYSNNFTLTGNWIYYYSISDQVGTLTNINISNNIFYYYSGINFSGSTTGNFTNNSCYGTSIACYNFQVNNNILMAGSSFNQNNNVYFNNIGDATQFGTANGNKQNITMASVWAETGAYNVDSFYVLAVGSPAIGAGYNGVDCGAFGGPNPYKIGGIPDVPTIYRLNVPAVGTSTISVTISTKSNN